MTIQYAQCWEDPATLRKALAVTPDDDVISIASGGDNSLALLLDDPRSVTAIDYNPCQIHLVELKARAIERLDYADFIAFVGARPHPDRLSLYARVRPVLSRPTRDYWDSRIDALSGGVIHCGKFENYFRLFCARVLPLIHSRNSTREFLSSPSLSVQQQYYHSVWNNARWQLLFKLFFSRLLLARLGRRPEFFRYVENNDIAATLYKRTERGLTQIPARDNYFVEYILTGEYHDLHRSHPYLSTSNYNVIKERIGRLKLVCGSIEQHLDSLPPSSASKLNLSDIFEYMSPDQVRRTLNCILRVCRPHARLAFWTLFVPQPVPADLAGRVEALTRTGNDLGQASRTFFYDQFCLWQTIGEN